MVDALLPRGFLALPDGDDLTVGRLQRKVRLLALRGLLSGSLSGLGPGRRSTMAAVRSFLTETLRSTPDLVVDAVGSPDVLPSLLALDSGAAPGETALRAIPSLLARLASEGPDTPIVWDAPLHQVSASDSGPLHALDGARAMLFARRDTQVEDVDGSHAALSGLPGVQRVHRVGPGVTLCLLDSNPLASHEAHPEKHGNAVSLGGRPVAEWLERLAQALTLLEHLPGWHAELCRTTARLIPVGFEPERHLSASYREAPGLIYLTLHPDPLTLAEALLHEAQHGKLNLLSWLDPVLVNGRTTWTTSPVRPDLRPLMGVLLAAHAFVPVAALHHALEHANHPITGTSHFERRRAEIYAGNQRALAILDELGEPTPVGRRVLDALLALHRVVGDPTRQHPDPGHLPPG